MITKIRNLNDEEGEQFKQTIKAMLEDESLKDLELLLRINSKLKQQYELRIEVLKELIHDKAGTDWKSKQFSDRD